MKGDGFSSPDPWPGIGLWASFPEFSVRGYDLHQGVRRRAGLGDAERHVTAALRAIRRYPWGRRHHGQEHRPVKRIWFCEYLFQKFGFSMVLLMDWRKTKSCLFRLLNQIVWLIFYSILMLCAEGFRWLSVTLNQQGELVWIPVPSLMAAGRIATWLHWGDLGPLFLIVCSSLCSPLHPFMALVAAFQTSLFSCLYFLLIACLVTFHCNLSYLHKCGHSCMVMGVLLFLAFSYFVEG